MYADDAVVFLKPSVRDATNLRDLLLNFGKVTGLQTNLQKTTCKLTFRKLPYPQSARTTLIWK
jgi:hypothetical protein